MILPKKQLQMHLKFSNLKNKICFLLISFCLQSFAMNNQLPEKLSVNAKISLLTCDEGHEIYSLFGHSALRILDVENQLDIVFNWGMFEWPEDQFDFGYQFAKGKLKYYMAIQPFNGFVSQYKEFKRGVSEQVLALNVEEKMLLYDKLLINYLPENRVYKYDFFYDNCSSRIRDILQAVLGNKLALYEHKDAKKLTFRNIIDVNLAPQPWLDLGIDLVLGSRIDVMANNHHLMFLPKYMEQIFDSSDIIDDHGNKEPFVIKKIQIVKPNKNSESDSTGNGVYFWTLLFITLGLIIFRINYLTMTWVGLILFIVGVLGILLIFMWVGTDHQATKSNFNLIWSNPLHLLTFISLFSAKMIQKLKNYYLGMSITLFSLVLFWIIIPQEIHPSVSPIILSLTLIYFFLYAKSKKPINTIEQGNPSS